MTTIIVHKSKKVNIKIMCSKNLLQMTNKTTTNTSIYVYREERRAQFMFYNKNKKQITPKKYSLPFQNKTTTFQKKICLKTHFKGLILKKTGLPISTY